MIERRRRGERSPFDPLRVRPPSENGVRAPDPEGEADPYPVTIIRTRYGGTYERDAAWAAFPLDEVEVPPEASGSDAACREFWLSAEAGSVGTGDTPDLALADMIRRSRVREFFTGLRDRDPAELERLRREAWGSGDD